MPASCGFARVSAYGVIISTFVLVNSISKSLFVRLCYTQVNAHLRDAVLRESKRADVGCNFILVKQVNSVLPSITPA